MWVSLKSVRTSSIIIECKHQIIYYNSDVNQESYIFFYFGLFSWAYLNFQQLHTDSSLSPILKLSSFYLITMILASPYLYMYDFIYAWPPLSQVTAGGQPDWKDLCKNEPRWKGIAMHSCAKWRWIKFQEVYSDKRDVLGSFSRLCPLLLHSYLNIPF
jgi:hypothetical protein